MKQVALEPQPIKIQILVPSHAHVHALFAYDLAQLMTLTTSLIPPDEGHQIGLSMNVGTYIHGSRTQLLQEALAMNVTHILWIDSDMRFPRDALIRLLARQVPIVGINYSRREIPASFTAVKKLPTPDGTEDGVFLVTGPESTGLEEVDSLGFGMVLMETSALAGLPDPRKEPWFWYERTASGRMVGEDVYFCMHMLRDRLKQTIYVDHDLSWQCAHQGDFEYKCAHAADEDVAAAIRALDAEVAQ
jgi:hypothetical protein